MQTNQRQIEEQPSPPPKPGKRKRVNFKTPSRNTSHCFTEGPIAIWEIHTTPRTPHRPRS